MSVMLYPCMLCVAMLMCLFVLCVACLTVFVNCLVKQFAMCLGVVAILLLNVMDVFSVCGGALLDRPCIVNKQFERLECVSESVYIDLQYDEISLTFTAGFVCLCGVSSPVVVLGLFVWLS